MEPTDEQIEKMWKFMGFKYVERTDLLGYWGWRTPGGYHALDCFRPPDPNNLFKYAVPDDYDQIIFQPGYCGLTVKDKLYEGTGDTQAEDLFWAIWEVIKDGKT